MEQIPHLLGQKLVLAIELFQQEGEMLKSLTAFLCLSGLLQRGIDPTRQSLQVVGMHSE